MSSTLHQNDWFTATEYELNRYRVNIDMLDCQKQFLERIKTFLPRELARVELEALAITQQMIDQRKWEALDGLFIEILKRYEQEQLAPGSMQTANFEDDVATFIPDFQSKLQSPLARAVELARENRDIRVIWYNFEHGGEYGGKSQLVLADNYSDLEDFFAPVPEHWLGNKIKKHPRFRLPKITIGVSSYTDYALKGAVEASILMRAHLNSRIAVAVCRTIKEIGTPGVPVVISRSTYNPVVYKR
ncbi:hypothetical protein [Thiolapillus sp.]